MRVLVIGAGHTGAVVLSQLRKNPQLQIFTVDPREKPYALQQGIVSQVDFQEPLTLYTIERIIKRISPDVVLVTTASEDMGLGKVPAIDILVESLRAELAAIADVPVISVARSK